MPKFYIPRRRMCAQNIRYLSFILYPWRFLSLAVFCSAAIAAFLTFLARGNKFLIVGLCVLVLYANRNFPRLVGEVTAKDTFYINNIDTTDISGEFLPRTANLSLIKYCKKQCCYFPKIETQEAVAFQITKDTSQVLDALYEAPKEFSATINIFYFPGWNYYLDGKQLKTIKLNDRGTVDLELPAGKHELEGKFENTPIRNLADGISLITLIIIGGYIINLILPIKTIKSKVSSQQPRFANRKRLH